jgi:hypothetical protein
LIQSFQDWAKREEGPGFWPAILSRGQRSISIKGWRRTVAGISLRNIEFREPQNRVHAETRRGGAATKTKTGKTGKTKKFHAETRRRGEKKTDDFTTKVTENAETKET